MPTQDTGIDLASIVSQLNSASATEGAQYKKGAADLAAAVTGAADELGFNREAILQATVAEKMAGRAREVATQDQVNKALKNFGLDFTDDTSPVMQLSAQLNQKQTQLQQQMAKIDSLRGTSLLDNPLKWIVNNIQLDSAESDYNMLQKEVSSISNLIHERAAAGQEATRAILSANSIQSEGEFNSALEVAARTTANANIEAKIRAMSTGVQALHESFTASKEDIGTRIELYRLKSQADKETRDRRLDSIQLESAQIHLNELKKSLAGKEVYSNLVKKSAIALGLPASSILTLPVEALEKVPGVTDAIPTLVAAGSVGQGPYSAYLTAISAGGGLYAPEYRQRGKKWVEDIVQSIDVAPEKHGLKTLPTKMQDRIPLYDAILRKKAAEEILNSKDNDQSVLTKMYPIGEYLKANSLKDNKLLREVIPGESLKTEMLSGEALLNYAVEGVKTGKYTSAQLAEDIKAIMNQHVDFINRSIAPDLLNLPKLGRYVIPTNGPGALSTAVATGRYTSIKFVDLLNSGMTKAAIDARVKTDQWNKEFRDSIKFPLMREP